MYIFSCSSEVDPDGCFRRGRAGAFFFFVVENQFSEPVFGKKRTSFSFREGLRLYVQVKNRIKLLSLGGGRDLSSYPFEDQMTNE